MSRSINTSTYQDMITDTATLDLDGTTQSFDVLTSNEMTELYRTGVSTTYGSLNALNGFKPLLNIKVTEKNSIYANTDIRKECQLPDKSGVDVDLRLTWRALVDETTTVDSESFQWQPEFTIGLHNLCHDYVEMSNDNFDDWVTAQYVKAFMSLFRKRNKDSKYVIPASSYIAGSKTLVMPSV